MTRSSQPPFPSRGLPDSPLLPLPALRNSPTPSWPPWGFRGPRLAAPCEGLGPGPAGTESHLSPKTRGRSPRSSRRAETEGILIPSEFMFLLLRFHLFFYSKLLTGINNRKPVCSCTCYYSRSGGRRAEAIQPQRTPSPRACHPRLVKAACEMPDPGRGQSRAQAHPLTLLLAWGDRPRPHGAVREGRLPRPPACPPS